jgi:hypothetical protein
MNYIPIGDEVARQIIDATTVFAEYRRVRGEAAKYAGGMYFKKEGAYEYLVKTRAGKRQERLGPRNEKMEQIHQEFHARKTALESRLLDLEAAQKQSERLNKALKAGRVPALVISILNAIENAGLDQHFTVVGTHALYAYETAAGIRIVPGALATQDVDLLWDARKRVRFLVDMGNLNKSMLQLLQEVDPTFVRMELQKETAINNRGFQVDFLRRMPEEDDPHPFQLSPHDGDLFAVQATRAHVLTTAPVFEHPVIDVNGRMAMMRTIAPRSFVEFKRWLAVRPDRDALKKRRDAHQADIVESLLQEHLLR